MRRYNWLASLATLLLMSGCVGQVSTTLPAFSTQTSTPQMPTSTITPMPVTKPSINTPQPLTAQEANTQVFDLLKNNGGCQLPCLWGLTPGKSDSQTFGDFISQFGNLVTPDIYLDVRSFNDGGGFTLIHRENNVHINVNFGYSKDKEGKLEMFGLSGYAMLEKGKDLDWKSSDLSPLYGESSFNQAFTYYLLPQILSNYGRPSQVLLKPFLEDPQRPDIQWQPFSLVLLYPEKGIFVEYIFPRETKGGNYAGCPSKATINLAVWDPQSSMSLEYVVQKAGLQINELNMDYFKPVEEATSMTLEQFYQTFKNPENTKCLETPQSLWQP